MLIHTRFYIGDLRKDGTKSNAHYPDHDNYPEIKAAQDTVCRWLWRDDNVVFTDNLYDAILIQSPRSESYVVMNFVPEEVMESYIINSSHKHTP